MNYKNENNKNKKNQEIIEKCIDNSYETHISSVISFGWRSQLANYKDFLKYKLFNFNYNRKFLPETEQIHFLYKVINPNNEKDLDRYNKNIKKILLITYRSKYRKQINIKNRYEYNSDCGWGCMIRSCQMIFARMLYKIFKHVYKNQYESETITISTIPFFMDDFLMTSELKNSEYKILGLESYIAQLNKYLKEKIEKNGYKPARIESIDPPFSIQKICTLGELFGRTCGEWFSDFELPKIFEIINSTFNIVPNLSILHFTSNIEIDKIIEKCFEKELDDKNPDLFINNYYINTKKEKYKFKKMGAIYVSVRLGVSTISSDYFPSIKKLFECKQFLGFIGGKVDTASYFFGYSDNILLYLDPHKNQDSDCFIDEKTIKTYINKTIYELEFKSLQCAFTIGFLFRTLNEFLKLIDFLKKFNNYKTPCFHVYFDDNPKMNDEELDKQIKYLENDQNDF